MKINTYILEVGGRIIGEYCRANDVRILVDVHDENKKRLEMQIAALLSVLCAEERGASHEREG